LFCSRDESAGTNHHAVISAAEPAISNLSEDMHAQMPLLLESMEVVLPHPDLTRWQSGLSFLEAQVFFNSSTSNAGDWRCQ